jgi:hypothetical protein
VTHKSNDGGPAHPLPHPSQHIPGISVRDFFAAAALTGFAANPTTKDGGAIIATACYRMADFMMAERAK